MSDNSTHVMADLAVFGVCLTCHMYTHWNKPCLLLPRRPKQLYHCPIKGHNGYLANAFKNKVKIYSHNTKITLYVEVGFSNEMHVTNVCLKTLYHLFYS